MLRKITTPPTLMLSPVVSDICCAWAAKFTADGGGSASTWFPNLHVNAHADYTPGFAEELPFHFNAAGGAFWGWHSKDLSRTSSLAALSELTWSRLCWNLRLPLATCRHESGRLTWISHSRMPGALESSVRRDTELQHDVDGKKKMLQEK